MHAHRQQREQDQPQELTAETRDERIGSKLKEDHEFVLGSGQRPRAGRVSSENRNEWTLVFNGPGRAQARGSVDNTVTLIGNSPDCNILITKVVGSWSRRGGTLVVSDDGLAGGVISVEAEASSTQYRQNVTTSGCQSDSGQTSASSASERITFEVPRRGQTVLNGTVRKPLVPDAAKAVMGGLMQLEGEEIVTYQLVQTPRGK